MTTRQIPITLDELVEAIGAAVPKLDATEQRIAVQAYRLLAERGPCLPMISPEQPSSTETAWRRL